MLVPLSWLKEYVDINTGVDELEEKLFSCGFEVEEKYEVGHDISKVVVGKVIECEAIPDTHLHLCKVDAGEAGVLQICCGADVRKSFLVTADIFQPAGIAEMISQIRLRNRRASFTSAF